VMVDLGRPWNTYNFFVPSKWQFNSAMFEVALCVMAYSTVLVIEFLPAILHSMETSRWVRFRRLIDWLQPRLELDTDAIQVRIDRVRAAAGWLRPKLEKGLIFIIVLGITLPTMHQSSLGSMLLLAAGSLILLRGRNRRSPRWLFVSAALIVTGGVLYRFNVYLIGFNPGEGWMYFPSLAEIMISVGIVAFEILGYLVLVKLVPVLPRIHFSASQPQLRTS